MLSAAALALLTFLAFANSFSAGFVLDNKVHLLQDPRIRELTGQNIRLILQHTYWWPTGETGLYRPFTTLSYLFNYAVLGNAQEPAGYHWVNFFLHLVNVFLVYALARRLLASDYLPSDYLPSDYRPSDYLSSDYHHSDCAEQSSASGDSQSFALRNPTAGNLEAGNPEGRKSEGGTQSFALRNPGMENPGGGNPGERNPEAGNPGGLAVFFVAALWAVHPVLTESVTNMIGRSDLLAALAVLSGFLMYLQAAESAG